MSLTLLSIFSPGDIALVAVVALFFFGGKKIPEFAKGLGKGVREFKDAQEGVSHDANGNPIKKV